MTRPLVGVIALAFGLAACSGTGLESVDSTSTTTTTTTTVPEATTTTVAVISAELRSVIEKALIEWSSGDTDRWRATFAPEAVSLAFGREIPIEAEQDGYEFIATQNGQYELVGCVPADGQVGEAASCVAELPTEFNTRLGLEQPVQGTYYFEVVDGLIVRTDLHNVAPFETIQAAWGDFVLWVSERNVDDALAMRSFPGNAAGAEIALGYMDEYFQDN
ncbi:MAG: hypothetical protein KJO36_08405 [Acidimicrobiia bacterium]|nr:hypothetical protein [Acidimicrobiia bacterium]NNL47450.1 hypothetical protein [Acidimicrobiia bacterium]